MDEFIEKNRQLLTSFCFVARIIAWVLLIVPAVGFAIAVLGPDRPYSGNPAMLLALPEAVLNIALLGFITLAVAAFVRYLLLDTDCRPGWILRYAHAFLYTGAGLIITTAILKCLFLMNTVGRTGRIDTLIVALLTSAVPNAAKVLILIGLGKILQRILPMIEESKTLV
ncbi:MAG: hypothetical protein ACYS9T_04400 [Planctomycetota bacterium]|jgi:uncharacterized membrane protein YidH (DUF202 family)